MPSSASLRPRAKLLVGVLLALVLLPSVHAATPGEVSAILGSVPEYLITMTRTRASEGTDVVGPGADWTCASTERDHVFEVACVPVDASFACAGTSVVAYGFIVRGTSACVGSDASCVTSVQGPQVATCRRFAPGAGSAPWTCRMAYGDEHGNAAVACGVRG